MFGRLERISNWLFGSNEKLIQAIRNYSLNEVSACIQGGMNVNEKYAIKQRHGFINSMAYEDSYVFLSPLSLACKLHGDPDIILALIKAGADVNNDDDYYGRTPLITAAKNGRVDAIKILVKYGAKVNFVRKFRDDYTPLIMAAKNGHVVSVQTLIEKGAKVNFLGMNGDALQSAICGGHIEVVKVLLDNGADYKNRHKNKHEWHTTTLLIEAARANQPDVIRLLFKRKIAGNIDFSDSTGSTALMYAAERGNLAAVQVLIEYNADPTIKNIKGQKAEVLAVSYSETRDIIRQALKNRKLFIKQNTQVEKLNTPCNSKQINKIIQENNFDKLQIINNHIQFIEQQGDVTQLFELKNSLQTHMITIENKLSCHFESHSNRGSITSQPTLFSTSLGNRKNSSTVKHNEQFTQQKLSKKNGN